ncbi:hypothetical protein BaRGS_00012524 [Batillaria attramentaria]|uniref:Uncharacterized protein n=1 Tax=Batillaria attramentaria TaxID=370345 RepID=A0ABD0L9P1_9CAEN
MELTLSGRMQRRPLKLLGLAECPESSLAPRQCLVIILNPPVNIPVQSGKCDSLTLKPVSAAQTSLLYRKGPLALQRQKLGFAVFQFCVVSRRRGAAGERITLVVVGRLPSPHRA